MPNLLVPIDVDDTSLQAIAFAAKLLKKEEFLTLLHVIRPIRSQQVARYIGRKQLEEFQREDAEKELARAFELVKEREIPHTTHFEFGEPSAIVNKYAAEHDLVVMGTHGHGPISGYLLGSVSNSVLKSVNRPLILVPNEVDLSTELKTILVAVDGSEGARRAVENAIQLARKMNVSCQLLHVVNPPAFYDSGENDVDGEDQQELMSFGNDILAQYEDLFLHYQMPYFKKVVIGNPASTIKNVAEETNSCLITLGYNGVNALAESIMGSVTYKVIHQTKIPVLIVK